MPTAEAEGACPRCGAAMVFRMARSDDVPPEMAAALQQGMIEHAAAEERNRRIVRDLKRLRVVFYLTAAAMVGSGVLYMNGNDMISKWFAVAASATSALSWFATATWVIDLGLRGRGG